MGLQHSGLNLLHTWKWRDNGTGRHMIGQALCCQAFVSCQASVLKILVTKAISGTRVTCFRCAPAAPGKARGVPDINVLAKGAY